VTESLSDKFRKLSELGNTGSDTRASKTPEAWQPRMDVDMAKGGYLVSTPRADGNSTDASEILEEFGLSPEEWRVTGVRKSRWQTYNENWLEAYRVSVVPADYVEAQDFDLEKLSDEMRKWRPSKVSGKTSGDGAFVVAPADQQIGKKANGEGTPESVGRILTLTEGAVHRVQELRKMGRSLGTGAMTSLGDHVEGNVSQNGRLQSPAASDLGQTEQIRVARRLTLAQVKALAPLFDEFIYAVVNGNHDEVTRQVVADPSDGWNVEIAAQIEDICAENPALQHIKFRYPQKDHQTLTVNIAGTLVGLFHGHQSGRDVTKYLSGQAAGQTSLGGADLWLSGHFHHFKVMDIGSRLWIQAPTTDPGSPWFRDRAGMESPAGLLTLTVGEGFDPRRDISIITLPKS
jgi:predicted phosphodiesterase